MKLLGTFLTGIGVLASCAAFADGIEYVPVIRCHAFEVHAKLAQACAEAHPELSDMAAQANAAWKARFGARATGAVETCPTEIDAVATTIEEREKLRAFMAELLEKLEQQIERDASGKDGSFCRRALAQLASERGYFGVFGK